MHQRNRLFRTRDAAREGRGWSGTRKRIRVIWRATRRATEPPATEPRGPENVRPARYLRTDIEDDWTSERI